MCVILHNIYIYIYRVNPRSERGAAAAEAVPSLATTVVLELLTKRGELVSLG